MKSISGIILAILLLGCRGNNLPAPGPVPPDPIINEEIKHLAPLPGAKSYEWYTNLKVGDPYPGNGIISVDGTSDKGHRATVYLIISGGKIVKKSLW